MSKIVIDTCLKTPNYCALEAVAEWMRANYTSRDYKKSRDIVVESGRKIKVTELPCKKGDKHVCDGNFYVKAI
ncbi:MAG: hypothetical protein KAS32_26635 [Candidatus Peribacteraceae bacterium]|nr:hypothetical protein [Candidatus Peribacteraceae bacterium]